MSSTCAACNGKGYIEYMWLSGFMRGHPCVKPGCPSIQERADREAREVAHKASLALLATGWAD